MDPGHGLKTVGPYANSEDPDQPVHSQSDQGLHYLLKARMLFVLFVSNSADLDHTLQMHRLIWVSTGRIWPKVDFSLRTQLPEVTNARVFVFSNMK